MKDRSYSVDRRELLAYAAIFGPAVLGANRAGGAAPETTPDTVPPRQTVRHEEVDQSVGVSVPGPNVIERVPTACEGRGFRRD